MGRKIKTDINKDKIEVEVCIEVKPRDWGFLIIQFLKDLTQCRDRNLTAESN